MVTGYFRGSLLCCLFFVLSAKTSSETNCFFKRSFCNWQNAQGAWERIHGYNESATHLPSARSRKDRYYIAISNQTESAKLISPEFRTRRACVSLWFSLSKGRNYTITVNTVELTTLSKTTLKNIDRDTWQHIFISVNPSKKFKVEIEGKVNGSKGYVAVDDIRITTGTTCSADCNFDDGWCAWKHGKGYSGKWERRRGGSDGGPLSDHTGDGYYIMNKGNGTKARLSVSQVGDGRICLTLWYYIIGNNTINIYLKTHTETERFKHAVNRVEGEDKWTKDQMTFIQQNAYEIIVEGVIAHDSTGDISIDDVTVRQGECEEKEDDDEDVEEELGGGGTEKEQETAAGKKTTSLIYVVAPPVIGSIIVIGVIAYIVRRKMLITRKSNPTETQHLSTESNCHSRPSFSNNAYIRHNSEPNNQLRSVSEQSDYAVIGDDNVNMSTDKAEYNVLNAKSKNQRTSESYYDRLKQSPTPFVNKSYSHVSHNNDNIVSENCNKNSNDMNVCRVITLIDKSILPFQAQDDLDDYDHAQTGAADSCKSDDYSHLHNAGGNDHNLDKGKTVSDGQTLQTKTQVADDNFGLKEEDNCKVCDYYILQNEEK